GLDDPGGGSDCKGQGWRFLEPDVRSQCAGNGRWPPTRRLAGYPEFRVKAVGVALGPCTVLRRVVQDPLVATGDFGQSAEAAHRPVADDDPVEGMLSPDPRQRDHVPQARTPAPGLDCADIQTAGAVIELVGENEGPDHQSVEDARPGRERGR